MGEDFFFSVKDRGLYGNVPSQMWVLPQRSVSYLWSRIRNRRCQRAEFIRQDLHRCAAPRVRAFKISVRAKGEV